MMLRDYAKRMSIPPKRQKPKGRRRFALVTVLIIVLFLIFITLHHRHPHTKTNLTLTGPIIKALPAKQARKDPPLTHSNVNNQFDFYTLLPKMKVPVSPQNTSGQSEKNRP